MKRDITYTLMIVLTGITLLGFIPTIFDFRQGKFLVGEWMMLTFVSMFFIKNMWLRLFMLWVVARHVLGFFEIGGISVNAQIKYFKVSYVSLNTLFMYIVGYQVFTDKAKDRYLNYILNGICIITLLHCAFILLQFCGVWVFIRPKVGLNVIKSFFDGLIIIADPINLISKRADTFTGILDNTNMTSSLLLLGLPPFFRKKWWFGLVPVIACLILARSLGGIIPATIISAIFLIFKLKRRGKDKAILAALFMIISLVIYLICTENLTILLAGSGRFKAWMICLSDPIPKRFIEGWGLGLYKVGFNAIVNTIYQVSLCPIVAHNSYIHTLFELGIVGLTLACGFVISVFMAVIRSDNEHKIIVALAIVAIVINAGGNFLFHTNVAWLALIYLGLLQTNKKGA